MCAYTLYLALAHRPIVIHKTSRQPSIREVHCLHPNYSSTFRSSAALHTTHSERTSCSNNEPSVVLTTRFRPMTANRLARHRCSTLEAPFDSGQREGKIVDPSWPSISRTTRLSALRAARASRRYAAWSRASGARLAASFLHRNMVLSERPSTRRLAPVILDRLLVRHG